MALFPLGFISRERYKKPYSFLDFIFFHFLRDSIFSFLRYRLVGRPSAQCVLVNNDVAWDKVPFCESKYILNVLCPFFLKLLHIPHSPGSSRWVLSSWYLMQITSVSRDIIPYLSPRQALTAKVGVKIKY